MGTAIYYDPNVPPALEPCSIYDDLSPSYSSSSSPVTLSPITSDSLKMPSNPIHRTINKLLLAKDRNLHTDPIEAYFSVGNPTHILGTERKRDNWDFVKEMKDSQIFIQKMKLEKYVYLIEHVLYPCYRVNKRTSREHPHQSHRGLPLYIMIALLNPENLYSYVLLTSELMEYITYSLESINEVLILLNEMEEKKSVPEEIIPFSSKRSMKEMLAIYIARAMTPSEKSYLNKVNLHAGKVFKMLQAL